MKNIAIFILILLTSNIIAFGQTKTTSQKSPLAGVNWDDEISEKQDTPDSDTGLSGVNWDDEVSEKQNNSLPETGLNGVDWDSEEELPSASTSKTDRAKHVSKEELFSHWLNGLLFLGYIIGCFGTAYFTRDRAISLKTPPEFLILLHTFWPIELLLTPFIKQAGKEPENLAG